MDTELLISEVFARTPIWQTKHKNHRNRGVIDKMWNEIAAALNCSSDDARGKWKYLKDNYRKEFKKTTTCRSGDAGGSKSSKWPFFELLYFLRSEVEPSRLSGNLSAVEEFDETFLESQSLLEENANEMTQMDVVDNLPNTDQDLQCSDAPARTSAPRKRKLASQEAMAEKMIEIEKEKIKLLKEDKVEQCEDYHFVMSLLPHLKAMQPLQKLHVRNKITQVIIDESRCQSGRSSTSSFTTFNYDGYNE